MSKSEGSGESSIRVKVETSAQGSGRSFIQLADGSEVERPDCQLFIKIERDRLVMGDWLLNGLTQEIHRVLGIWTDLQGDVQVKLSTHEGFVQVPWRDIPETLLLVIDT